MVEVTQEIGFGNTYSLFPQNIRKKEFEWLNRHQKWLYMHTPL